VWRCQIDLSRPSPPVWRFLRRAIQRYAFAIFHVPQFAQRLTTGLVASSVDDLVAAVKRVETRLPGVSSGRQRAFQRVTDGHRLRARP
jgi:hypothetical protein